MAAMTAIAWSLVALMAASLGVLATALFHLDGKIDGGFARVDARIDGLGASLNARIDAQTAMLTAEIRDLRTTVHDLGVRVTRAWTPDLSTDATRHASAKSCRSFS